LNRQSPQNISIQAVQSSNVTIAIAKTLEERQAVFRLRYQVYVDEQKRQLGDIDYDCQMLVDAMDDDGILLCLRSDSVIVGTLRLHIGSISSFPQDISLPLQMNLFQQILETMNNSDISFCSKLAVHAKFRSSPAVYMLLAKAYEIFRERGISFNFCGCAPYMLSFYEQLGFRRYSGNFTVPGYGYMVPLVLITEDADYLRKVRSPLFRIAQNKPKCQEIAKMFLETFPDSKSLINTRVAKASGLLQHIQSYRLRIDRIPLFQGLSLNEVEKVLTYCVIIDCQANDILVHPTDIGNELFLVLDGLVLCTYISPRSVKIFKPRQSFGGNALIGRPEKRNYQVQALTESTLLILSTQQFHNLCRRHSAIGTVIAHNAIS
jgi:predicted GNAT family N-acyltransferase